MEFEVGKFYRHTSGSVMHILTQVDNCTGYFVPCLVAESPDRVGFLPVGADEDAAANWREIPPHEYYQVWYKANPSKELRLLATPPEEKSMDDNTQETNKPYNQLLVAVQDLLIEMRIDRTSLEIMANGYSPDYPGWPDEQKPSNWENPHCRVQLSKVVAQKLFDAGVFVYVPFT